VFDHPELWKEKTLPEFDGITLLTIATPYPHKNLTIAADSARLLREQHPHLKFRFVLSNERSEFPADISDKEDCFEFIGKVDIAECPSLYQQCDIVFQPTLLECFTAAYPEAMRMERPIITTDLEFARGLCGEAAEYYSAIDAQACADVIYKVASDKLLRERLITEGKEQLKKFDNYSQRAEKLIKLIEEIVKIKR
jgi:glycosyltransferase involved in cell wall biosynthesis